MTLAWASPLADAYVAWKAWIGEMERWLTARSLRGERQRCHMGSVRCHGVGWDGSPLRSGN